MQFKNPEILYALFLLLIPIFIHLFQLRRFQKVAFTNVAFLKRVTSNTRKSSSIRKWLVLAMRLLALACIIFAFAQPYNSSKTSIKQENETVLYIDNSFSMQAKGRQGTLLKRALQDVFESSNNTNKISWFNNTLTFKNRSLETNKNELLAMPYSSNQLSLSEVVLKADQLFSKDLNTNKRLLVISDFQDQGKFPEIDDNITVEAVQLKPEYIENVSVDSAFVKKNGDKLNLIVKLIASGNIEASTPISLYNNGILKAKTTADFSSENHKTLSFDLEAFYDFKGKIEITDGNLLYDNDLYFNLGKKKPINVLSINEENAGFLSRLFKDVDFGYKETTVNKLSYKIIPEQNFIVLNGLKTIPSSLTTALLSFRENGGTISIIPSVDSNLQSYNTLLERLGLGSISSEENSEKRITKINFDHPLYQNVFEKKVVNFQFPKISSYYKINTNVGAALKLEDGSAFIVQKKNCYLIAGSLSDENSNFKNSPLIVPTFYNMAQNSLKLPKLYYTVGVENNFSIAEKLKQDEIITIKDSTFSFIPLQQTKANQVNITTLEEPSKAGIFDLVTRNSDFENISYNYNRLESNLQYANIKDWKGVQEYDSVKDLFASVYETDSIDSFWKWFAIFALFFLIMEMLILKFFK